MVVLRSIIVSGYLYYPSTLRIGGLDWAVPKTSAEIDLNVIEAWAKTPAVPYEQVLQSNSWIHGWIQRWKQHLLLPSVSILLGSCVLIAAGRYKPSGLLDAAPRKLFIAVLMLAAFWGYTAPDPRFAVGLIAVGVALPTSWGLTILRDCRIMRLSAAKLLLLFVLGTQYLYIAMTPTYPYSTLLRKASDEFKTGLIPFEGAPTKAVVLKSGLVIQVPTDEGGCFRTEMCTIGVSSMNVGLSSRGPNISDGFRIED